MSSIILKPLCVCCLVALIAGGSCSVIAASSVNWDSSYKTAGLDSANGDRLGFSVALNQSRALVGAPRHGAQGTNSGTAYLFDVVTGSQIFKLLPNDAPPYGQYANDWFGHSVALNQGEILVGAPFDDQNGSDAGAIYAFDGTNGVQHQKLIAESLTGGENFGYSVAVEGDTAVVGALTDSGLGGALGVGAAYVYEFNGTGWSESHKLLINDPLSLDDGDLFGWSVDISGNTAIVGGRDHLGNSGTAYLFDTNTGSQIAKLSAADAGVSGLGDANGSAVTINGDYALVGSTATQEVYVFQDSGTGWSLMNSQTIVANDTGSGDLFGWSLDLEGHTALISAPEDNDRGLDSGSAYFFDVTTGNQIDKIVAFDGAPFDSFGYSVAIDENRAYIGARFEVTGGQQTGAAYLYSLPADFDNNSVVNGSDLAVWGNNLGSTLATHAMGDANLDGIVSGADFLIWQRQNTTANSTVLTQIPEPASGGFLLLACLLVVGSRQRR